MSAARHTPGPWLVTEASDWAGMSGVSLGIDDAFGQDGGRDYHLATVVHGDPDELQANARFIAAAPDVHKALRELHRVCKGMDLANQMKRPTEARYQSAMAAAAAALKQAGGK